MKVYQETASSADEVLLELDFGWTSEAELSMIVHPMPHQAWLATPVVEVLSKLIVVKVIASIVLLQSLPLRPMLVLGDTLTTGDVSQLLACSQLAKCA